MKSFTDLDVSGEAAGVVVSEYFCKEVNVVFEYAGKPYYSYKAFHVVKNGEAICECLSMDNAVLIMNALADYLDV